MRLAGTRRGYMDEKVEKVDRKGLRCAVSHLVTSSDHLRIFFTVQPVVRLTWIGNVLPPKFCGPNSFMRGPLAVQPMPELLRWIFQSIFSLNFSVISTRAPIPAGLSNERGINSKESGSPGWQTVVVVRSVLPLPDGKCPLFEPT